MRITLRQLEIFAAIARTENVSHASAQLSMSQSAASNALAELERQFDRPLFDRVGKALRLNGTGRGLLPLAIDLLDRAAAAEAYLAGGRPGPLSVGATLTIGNYLATLIVAEYQRRHPESRVDLRVVNTRAVFDQLSRFEIDLGLVEDDIGAPEIALDPWLEDSLAVFCAPGHPLAGRGAVDARTLARQPWIVRERGSGTRQLFDRVVARRLGEVDIRLELEHTEAIKRAVESGLGIGCLSRLSLREAFRRGSLIEIPTPRLDLRRRYCFAWHRRRQLSPAAHAFIALCRETSGRATSTEELDLPFIP